MRIPPPPQWLMIALVAASFLALAIHQMRGENAAPIDWSQIHE